MLGDPAFGVVIRPLDVVLEVVAADAVRAAAADLDVPELAAADERVGLR
jgi:hypothetical protein